MIIVVSPSKRATPSGPSIERRKPCLPLSGPWMTLKGCFFSGGTGARNSDGIGIDSPPPSWTVHVRDEESTCLMAPISPSSVPSINFLAPSGMILTLIFVMTHSSTTASKVKINIPTDDDCPYPLAAGVLGTPGVCGWIPGVDGYPAGVCG
jgi:hypothetical protein